MSAPRELRDGEAARLRVRAGDLFEPVLERIVAALAARVDMPIDRLSDAQLVAATVAAGARRAAPDGELCVDLATRERAVEIGVGPLPAGAGARLVADSALPGVGVVLDRLPDRWGVSALGDGRERLQLTIAAATPAAS